ncbi:MAG: exosome complex protein Rrp42 [Candidatus Nanohaloarchaeota archaeon QJJ-9]|nr:exosome complex protein Rrp42 [Candidatus Nanohaloarchaeota archaeon QJJ-9]
MLKINEENLVNSIKTGERVDGRSFEEYRDIEIIPNYVHETADGSTLVKIGDTRVLVGISIDTGEPYPDTPDKGAIISNAELTEMASPEYESGPPGEDAIELARVVDRGIRESGMLDLEDLVIEEGEKCWMVFVDIHVLDYDGNLIEAASIGAVASLLQSKVPKLNDDGTVDREEYEEDLPTEEFPLTVTSSSFNGEILFDATADEEEVRDARLSVTFTEDDNIVAMQKGGRQSLRGEQLVEMLEKSREKSQFLREKIVEALE